MSECFHINQTKIEIQTNQTQVELYPYASISIASGQGARGGNTLTASGYIAGEVVAAYSLVVSIAGKIYTASNSDLKHAGRVIGIAQSNAEAGSSLLLSTDGILNYSGWDWNTDNQDRLFVGEDGAIVPKPDFNAAFMQEVGSIISRNQLYLDIQEPTLL